MHPREEDTLVPADMLRPDLAVFDIVYNPLKTRLLKDAEVAGAKTISGVDMLVYQGAASFKIWTGLDAPVDVMKKTVLEKLSS
jgi:shikimate dehydrogenase